MTSHRFRLLLSGIPRVWSYVLIAFVVGAVVAQAQQGARGRGQLPPNIAAATVLSACVADPQSPACFQQRLAGLEERLARVEQLISKTSQIRPLEGTKDDSATRADLRPLQDQIDQIRQRLNQVINQLRP
jgi:hypothetical protein